jgi:hypothetical protein
VADAPEPWIMTHPVVVLLAGLVVALILDIVITELARSARARFFR